MQTVKINNITELKTRRGSDKATVEVLGYYTSGDGGGGNFYWDNASTETDNGGTIIQVSGVSTGRWKRSYSSIDARHFGVISDNSTDNTTALQKYFNYCVEKKEEIYLQEGIIRFNSPIVINAVNGLVIKGKGSSLSQLYFNSNTSNISGITINGAFNKSYSFSNFEIRKEDDPSNMKGVGLDLNNIQNLTLKDVTIFRYDIGLKLTNSNILNFENLKIHYCKTGLLGVTGTLTPPNLIKFTNCTFNSNEIKGIMLNALHSIYFDNCTFEDNGTQSLSNSGAFEGIFTPVNGLNSVNFNSCYFERTGGQYDIKIQSNSSGTSSITNCTFNRIDITKYSNTNIYLVSDPTSTSEFVNTINISGNGFFAANTYTSDYGRPTLGFNSNSLYKGFNVVENNNVFSNIVDAFVIPQQYKQESYNTKLLASARIQANGTLSYGYNILSAAKQSTGNYLITFANPLPKNPIISALPVGVFAIPYIGFESLSSIIILTKDASATNIDAGLSITVH